MLLRELPPLHTMFPVQRIIVWVLHGLVAFVYTQHYYPDMPLAWLHAFLLPLAALPWVLMVVYSHTLWRGYQGEAPRMSWPEMPVLAATLRDAFASREEDNLDAAEAFSAPSQTKEGVTEAPE